jgi:predicted DNA repair protein MutK
MDNNIRIWFICFVVLFALSQLFDWVQQLSLPLPIYILGGAFLAVASNYEKLFGSYLGEYSPENSTKNNNQQQLDAASQPEVSIYEDEYQYVEEIEELEIRDLGSRE